MSFLSPFSRFLFSVFSKVTDISECWIHSNSLEFTLEFCDCLYSIWDMFSRHFRCSWPWHLSPSGILMTRMLDFVVVLWEPEVLLTGCSAGAAFLWLRKLCCFIPQCAAPPPPPHPRLLLSTGIQLRGLRWGFSSHFFPVFEHPSPCLCPMATLKYSQHLHCVSTGT